MFQSRLAICVFFLLLVATACVADDSPAVVGVSAPQGYKVTEFFTGLSAPTQITSGPDNTLLVAQLNGVENESNGQIVSIALDGAVQEQSIEVLYDGLDKPTGVAYLNNSIYVMERNRLSRGSFASDQLAVIADDLPSNGRSEGTLTVTPNETLLFNTSGSIRNGDVIKDSGVLWELTPGAEPMIFATGFKNGYAHHYDPDGQLWVSEVSDGLFDGQPANDKVVAVSPNDNGGWPRCINNRTPVKEYDGDITSCQRSSKPLNLFEPGATPTSLTTTPWDEKQLLVALWNEGKIISTRLDSENPTPETLIEGIAHPQHLLAHDQAVLIVDFDEGRILSLTKK